MTTGALDQLDDQIERMLIITRHGYADTGLSRHDRVRQLEAGHPVPDQASLDAGRELLDFIAAVPPSASILFLISGGTSALVEVLPQTMTLAELQRVNHWLLGSGLPVQAMNSVRSALSAIKGGRLLARLQGRRAQVLLISDVSDDNPVSIGSGLLSLPPQSTAGTLVDVPEWLDQLLSRVGAAGLSPLNRRGSQPEVSHHIVANADQARLAAVRQAQRLAYPVYEHRQRLIGDIHDVAVRLLASMETAGPGLHLWSGETTLTLPDRPGTGGRCQSLALALVLLQAENDRVGHKHNSVDASDWLFLAAGSDGRDGPGEAAGALVDDSTWARVTAAGLDPRRCLDQADAGQCLQASNDLVFTGPTGTNVMDIMLGLRLR